MMNYAIGKRIRAFRIVKNISQTAMAKNLNVSCEQYILLENGGIDFSLDILNSISNCLGLEVRDITNISEFELTNYFRDAGFEDDVIESISNVEKLIQIYHVQEKLYHQRKEREARI